jgi:Domain of Unknown Function (DUF1206)
MGNERADDRDRSRPERVGRAALPSRPRRQGAIYGGSWANEAIGIDGALRKLTEQPYGVPLLGPVAAGLLAYAASSLVQARYREV